MMYIVAIVFPIVSMMCGIAILVSVIKFVFEIHRDTIEDSSSTATHGE